MLHSPYHYDQRILIRNQARKTERSVGGGGRDDLSVAAQQPHRPAIHPCPRIVAQLSAPSVRDQLLPVSIDSSHGNETRHQEKQKDTKQKEGKLFHDRQLYAAQALPGFRVNRQRVLAIPKLESL